MHRERMLALVGLLGAVACIDGCARDPQETTRTANEGSKQRHETSRFDATPAWSDSWAAWLSSSDSAPLDADVARMRTSGEAGARELIAALREGSGDRAQVRRGLLILFLAGETTARVAREFALESAGRSGDMWWPLWCQVLTGQARDSKSRETRAIAIRELAWDVRVRPSMYGLIKSELQLPFSGVGHVTEADIGEFVAVVEPWLRSDDQALRASCVSAVAKLGRTRIDAWDLFVGLLEDRDEAVRAEAADWLWLLRADDPDIRRDVERLGGSEDSGVALACARVLGRGGGNVPVALRRRVTTEILRMSSPPTSQEFALRVATELTELVPDEIPAVVAACRSTDRGLRGAAVRALGNAPAYSAEARAILVSIAASPHADTSDRLSAIWALPRRWPNSKEVWSALLQAAASEDVAVASDARRALAERGPLADEAVASYLGGCLKSAKLGELTPLVATLRDRAELSPALARSVRDLIDRGDSAVGELLIPLLAGARLATTDDLRRLSTASPPATEAIVDTAYSLLEVVPVVDLLAVVGPDARRGLIVRVVESSTLPFPVRDGLSTLLRHEDARVRSGAAQLCGKWGVRDGPILTILREAVGDPDGVVRSAAARALWKFGDRSPTLISEIVRSLDDRDARVQCIRWLGEIGPAAAIAAPRLAEIVGADEALETRLAACDAIAALHVEDSDVVATLSRALRAGYSSTRALESLEAGVSRALATMGPSARSAIADLINVAEDRMPFTLSDAATIQARCQALRALGDIGGLAEREVMAVRTLSKSSQVRDVRRVAAELLRRCE